MNAIAPVAISTQENVFRSVVELNRSGIQADHATIPRRIGMTQATTSNALRHLVVAGRVRYSMGTKTVEYAATNWTRTRSVQAPVRVYEVVR